MKIAVYSANAYERPFLISTFKGQHELIFIEKPLNIVSVNLAETCDAIMLFTSDFGTASVLESLAQKGIKFIALRSVGYDHVDLKRAASLHMKVANVPSYSPYAVAEHAVLLLLALNRKLLLGQERMKKNDFRLNELTGFDLHEKTVGVVGLGKIGKVFSKIMNGFGCNVICYDPKPDLSLEKEMNLKFVSLAELGAQADVISIHCPLTKDSKHLFNKALFGQVKKGVYLINTSRGAVINTIDLLEAVENGILGGVGMDVYEFEKGLFFQDHQSDTIQDAYFEKLKLYKNVLITGHQGFLTDTALKNIAEASLYNLNCFAKGMKCENELH
jgi:D-lactate dehydrogenase